MGDKVDDSMVGLVLSGGGSVRMGSDKSELRTADGKTFAQIAVDRLRQVCRPVWISGAAKAASATDEDGDVPLQRRGVADRLIKDDVGLGGAGPMLGIATALIAAAAEDHRGVLVTPVDTPHLSVSDLQRLIAAVDDTAASPIPVIAHSDRLNPTIGFYPVEMIASLRSALSDGQCGLTRWLSSRHHRRVQLSSTACFNVNTPEDYEQLSMTSNRDDRFRI